jgi:hypothetical protein
MPPEPETDPTGATPATDPATDTDPTDATPTKDWESEAEKWKSLARKNEKTAKANADAAKRLAELEDANKTEVQKLSDKAAEATKQAEAATATALRLEVALEKAPDGMPVDKIRSLAKRLAGATREELEADADELFSEFGESKKPPGKTPKPDLKGGGKPDAEPDIDPEKIAAKIYDRHRL